MLCITSQITEQMNKNMIGPYDSDKSLKLKKGPYELKKPLIIVTKEIQFKKAHMTLNKRLNSKKGPYYPDPFICRYYTLNHNICSTAKGRAFLSRVELFYLRVELFFYPRVELFFIQG